MSTVPLWLSPIIIFLAFVIYAVVHSLLAALQIKDAARRWFGKFIVARYYRLAYNLFAILSLLPILALLPLLPDQRLYTIPFPWTLLALAGQGLAVLLLLVALVQTGPLEFLGISQVFTKDEEDNPQLVTKGAYRWVRHPLYTAGLIFIWLAPVMSQNLLALNIAFTLYLILGAWVEEAKLRHIFGQRYQEYKARTPMLIPWARRK